MVPDMAREWKDFSEWVAAVKTAETGGMVDPRLVPMPIQGPFTRGLYMTPEMVADCGPWYLPDSVHSLMPIGVPDDPQPDAIVQG